MSEPDANELIKQMANGDKQAFAEFYRLMEKPIYRFICVKLNDPFEANDILHEVFMDVWRTADKFEGRSTVKTWLFGIAYRKTIDRFRKMKRVVLTDEMPDLAESSASQVDILAAGEESQHIRFCIDELSLEHRQAIELAFYEDMTYREIADVARSAEGTIKTRIFHAKQLLKRCLSSRIGVVEL